MKKLISTIMACTFFVASCLLFSQERDDNPEKEIKIKIDPVALTLTLTDRRTQYSKEDETDSRGDAPMIYCTGPLPDGTGQIKIDLDADGGSYDWYISGTAHSGTLSGPYWVNVDGLEPGNYSVVVTNSNDSFNRTIDFAVIEYGEYSPSSYPYGDIDTIEDVGSSNPYSYCDDGELRSITVSAPIDGDENATNPYAYGTNYQITINQDTGTATVVFSLPGIYMLQAKRDDGGGDVLAYETIAYDSPRKGPLDPATWPWVCILKPHWDYYVGPNTTETVFANSWASVDIAKGKWSCWNIAQEASTVSIERLVAARYAAVGNTKLDLCIDQHGLPAKVKSMTGGWIDASNVAATLGNQIAGKVKRIRFYSCLTGDGGGTFLDNLRVAAGATEVSAYVSETSVSGWPYIWSAGKWGNKTIAN